MEITNKQTWGLTVIIVGVALALVMLVPAISFAQVPVDTDDILCYTQEEANQILMDGFELEFPVCDDEDEGNGGGDDDEDDDGEGSEDDNDTDGNDNGSGSSSTSGGGGGKPHYAGTPSSVSYNGEVLGESTETCSTPLLMTYLGLGKNNNADEVLKLQNFLNTELGLSLATTSVFDAETKAAVEQFQLKYADEILAPWLPHGHVSTSTPTGYVYKTTQRMINKIHCAELELPMPQLP